MRKVVLYTLMSIDGAVDHPGRYFRDPREDDAIGPPFFDDEMVALEKALIARQDAVLLGRRMYDEWSRFWPSADDHFAPFINDTTKFVFTSTPLTSEWSNTVAVTEPAERFVARLKSQPGGDIGVHGSIDLARSLLRAGLVDEIVLVAGPTIDPQGRRLFEAGDPALALELLSARATPSGTLWLVYRRGARLDT